MAKLGLMILDSIIEEFPIDKRVMSIGRSPNCDIRLEDQGVSRNHAVIWHELNTLHRDHHNIYIDDLDSKNGTLVNDLSVTRHQLKLEDEITTGSFRFRLLNDHG